MPTGLSGLATDEAQASADEGEVGANSVGSDGGTTVVDHQVLTATLDLYV